MGGFSLFSQVIQVRLFCFLSGFKLIIGVLRKKRREHDSQRLKIKRSKNLKIKNQKGKDPHVKNPGDSENCRANFCFLLQNVNNDEETKQIRNKEKKKNPTQYTHE